MYNTYKQALMDVCIVCIYIHTWLHIMVWTHPPSAARYLLLLVPDGWTVRFPQRRQSTHHHCRRPPPPRGSCIAAYSALASSLFSRLREKGKKAPARIRLSGKYSQRRQHTSAPQYSPLHGVMEVLMPPMIWCQRVDDRRYQQAFNFFLIRWMACPRGKKVMLQRGEHPIRVIGWIEAGQAEEGVWLTTPSELKLKVQGGVVFRFPLLWPTTRRNNLHSMDLNDDCKALLWKVTFLTEYLYRILCIRSSVRSLVHKHNPPVNWRERTKKMPEPTLGIWSKSSTSPSGLPCSCCYSKYLLLRLRYDYAGLAPFHFHPLVSQALTSWFTPQLSWKSRVAIPFFVCFFLVSLPLWRTDSLALVLASLPWLCNAHAMHCTALHLPAGQVRKTNAAAVQHRERCVLFFSFFWERSRSSLITATPHSVWSSGSSPTPHFGNTCYVSLSESRVQAQFQCRQYVGIVHPLGSCSI